MRAHRSREGQPCNCKHTKRQLIQQALDAYSAGKVPSLALAAQAYSVRAVGVALSRAGSACSRSVLWGVGVLVWHWQLQGVLLTKDVLKYEKQKRKRAAAMDGGLENLPPSTTEDGGLENLPPSTTEEEDGPPPKRQTTNQARSEA